MCFSATASFLAGGALVSTGVVAIRKLRLSKKDLCLAAIPIIFGVHQISEGVVWLGIDGKVPDPVEVVAMYFYVFIAMCFWPVFIPLALLQYEYPKKRHLFLFLTISGAFVGGYLLWCFSAYSELYIDVECCRSIAYTFELPYLEDGVDYFYLAVVALPGLFSSNTRIRNILGPVLFVTFCIASAASTEDDYPSIWCFLAAVISVSIYYSLAWRTKECKA